MADDPIEVMINALYVARQDLPEGYRPKMSDITRQTYERMARAALTAIHINNSWYGAPGDKHQCPVCETPFEAVSAGPLDIKWVMDP